MLPEVNGGSSDAVLRRLLSRKGVTSEQCESLLAQVEERGSAYLPQLNAFCVREFQMMQAAEDAARFLHHACRGLPSRLIGGSNRQNGICETTEPECKADDFYSLVVEHAVAYFGSCVLYPSRPSPEAEDPSLISWAGCKKAAQAAVRGDRRAFGDSARALGFRVGSRIYAAYISGKISTATLRRLFLTHLDGAGQAAKVCAAIVSRLRALFRPAARAAHV
jgi:hypothetical protein